MTRRICAPAAKTPPKSEASEAAARVCLGSPVLNLGSRPSVAMVASFTAFCGYQIRVLQKAEISRFVDRIFARDRESRRYNSGAARVRVGVQSFPGGTKKMATAQMAAIIKTTNVLTSEVSLLMAQV